LLTERSWQAQPLAHPEADQEHDDAKVYFDWVNQETDASELKLA
jgi:hypothetical protein